MAISGQMTTTANSSSWRGHRGHSTAGFLRGIDGGESLSGDGSAGGDLDPNARRR
jgi:hypothetical protein